MTCPTCGGELVAGAERCPVCDVGTIPRVEGALAKDPRLLTPPARPKSRLEPLREIPALRKREKTWRDEVQERVRSRRQKRAAAGLPLFDEPEEPAATNAEPAAVPPPPLVEPEAAAAAAPEAPPHEEPLLRARPVEPDLVSTRLTEAELADLPLRPGDGAPEEPAVRGESAAVRITRRPVPSLDEDVLLGDAELEAEIELPAPTVDAQPVERPATPAARARAAAIDAILFAALAALVVYFTGRAARVETAALVASWPALASYLALLALFYAGYFTGTTGQTPGKLATGLRVVDSAGRPPGYARAMGRALVGLLGIALAGLGLLPMIFDPAARAAQDRLFRTRVVRG
jgi:uncharacterized RDD family membrane protein YckC